MIRISLIAAALLSTIATGSSALAQAGAPGRTLGPAETTVGSTMLIAERKAAPCTERNCAGRPVKRDYVGAASLGW